MFAELEGVVSEVNFTNKRDCSRLQKRKLNLMHVLGEKEDKNKNVTFVAVLETMNGMSVQILVVKMLLSNITLPYTMF